MRDLKQELLGLVQSFEENQKIKQEVLVVLQAFEVDPHDPQVLPKIAALKARTSDKDMLVILDNFESQVAGYQLSGWIPRGVGRKFIMMGIVVAAALGVVYSSLPWLLLLFLLPLFSPRAMGEAAFFSGRVTSLLTKPFTR